MNVRLTTLSILVLLALAAGGTLVLAGGGTFVYDVVRFRRTNPVRGASAAPQPRLWIDTRAEHYGWIVLWGGASSRAPYDVVLNYTDSTLTFAEMELESVAVTYADGTEEPAAAALSLPSTVAFRDHVARRGTSGGIVTTDLRILQHSIRGVITRDQDVEVKIEGRFVTEAGESVPFRLDHRYECAREQGKQPMYRVWRDM